MDDQTSREAGPKSQMDAPNSKTTTNQPTGNDQFLLLSTAASIPTSAHSNSKSPSTSTSTSPILLSKRASNPSSLQSASPLKNVLTSTTTSQSRQSREPSPLRSPVKTAAPIASTSSSVARSPGSRSRRNSSKNVSPVRSSSGANTVNAIPPSIQGALASSAIPQLHHANSEPSISKAAVPQRPQPTPDTHDSQRLSRLRSPPPLTNNKQVAAVRRAEAHQFPIINVQKPTPPSRTPVLPSSVDSQPEDPLTTSGTKTSARGISTSNSTLETVEETSQPGTPTLAAQAGRDGFDRDLQRLADQQSRDAPRAMDTKGKGTNESGSDSGGPKGETKMRSSSAALTPLLRPTSVPPPKPYSTVAAGRGKPSGEGSTRNMTVETETVSSIPQVAVSGAGGPGINGSLRAKPSSETIRPKKEKKKVARKAPSVASGMGELQLSLDTKPRPHHHHQASRSISSQFSVTSPTMLESSGNSWASGAGALGSSRKSSLSPLRVPSLTLGPHDPSSKLTIIPHLVSSKADIFEAKIASAVDEANSSDSEETFVYESNPPEPSNQHRRYHSRTPSATSLVSQLDHRGNSRSMLGGDANHSVVMKKSMKFANNYLAGPDNNGIDDGKGTARSNLGTGRGPNQHHVGRWTRNGGGNGHSSIFDNESPFPNAKSKFGGNNSRHSSRPSSPRLNKALNGSGKKGSPMSSNYDVDDGADDERTPLVATSIRSARSGRNRRPPSSSLRQMEHQGDVEELSLISRFSGCLLLMIVVILVIGGGFGFTYATTQPLSDVKVLGLRNVLVSQQELMLDMEVMARNPNVVVVTVDCMNIEVFARSRHADDWDWFKLPDAAVAMRRVSRTTRAILAAGIADDPPIDDDPDETQTLKLGQILQFDSPLAFEGSPFSYSHTKATGGVRLVNPGNTTEAGGEDGMDKWGKVLKYEFDLRIKGVLAYQLPLSQKTRKASVDFTTRVKPSKSGGPEDDSAKKRLHDTI